MRGNSHGSTRTGINFGLTLAIAILVVCALKCCTDKAIRSQRENSYSETDNANLKCALRTFQQWIALRKLAQYCYNVMGKGAGRLLRSRKHLWLHFYLQSDNRLEKKLKKVICKAVSDLLSGFQLLFSFCNLTKQIRHYQESNKRKSSFTFSRSLSTRRSQIYLLWSLKTWHFKWGLGVSLMMKHLFLITVLQSCIDLSSKTSLSFKELKVLFFAW